MKQTCTYSSSHDIFLFSSSNKFKRNKIQEKSLHVVCVIDSPVGLLAALIMAPLEQGEADSRASEKRSNSLLSGLDREDKDCDAP